MKREAVKIHYRVTYEPLPLRDRLRILWAALFARQPFVDIRYTLEPYRPCEGAPVRERDP